jgi:hypothetical protein
MRRTLGLFTIVVLTVLLSGCERDDSVPGTMQGGADEPAPSEAPTATFTTDTQVIRLPDED